MQDRCFRLRYWGGRVHFTRRDSCAYTRYHLHASPGCPIGVALECALWRTRNLRRESNYLADDLAADAVLRVVRHMGKGALTLSRCYRLALSSMLYLLRERRQLPIDSTVDVQDLPDPRGDDEDNQLDARGVGLQLLDRFGYRLVPTQERALRSMFEGKKGKDIASARGVTKQAVYASVVSGRERLRRALVSAGGSP